MIKTPAADAIDLRGILAALLKAHDVAEHFARAGHRHADAGRAFEAKDCQLRAERAFDDYRALTTALRELLVCPPDRLH